MISDVEMQVNLKHLVYVTQAFYPRTFILYEVILLGNIRLKNGNTIPQVQWQGVVSVYSKNEWELTSLKLCSPYRTVSLGFSKRILQEENFAKFVNNVSCVLFIGKRLKDYW